MPIVRSEAAFTGTLYVCDGCGASAEAESWRSPWRWYGSIEALENGDPIGISCGASPECDAAAEKAVTRRRTSPAQARARKTKHDRLVASALAKLTPEEREALELEVEGGR